MQIENEILQFTSETRPLLFKSTLSALQIQYLVQLEKTITIEDLIMTGLKNGSLVNFSLLYELLKKMVEQKIIQNKNIHDYFHEIQNNTNLIPVSDSKKLSPKKSEDYKKDFKDLIKLPFLRSLDSDIAKVLLQESEILDYMPESLICKKGDPLSRYLYILLSGEAAVYGQGAASKKFISLIKPSAVFGEMGFFLGLPRTADIIATRQSKVLVINGNSDFMNKYLNSNKAEHLVQRFWIQQALVSSEVFKNIPTESIDQLTAEGDILKISENQILFSENEMTNGAYIVVQGVFSVQINKKIVAKISQGQMIGEISLFQTQGKRSATVIADKDAVLMHISLQKFYQLLSQNLYLAKTLQELSQKRFDQNKKT